MCFVNSAVEDLAICFRDSFKQFWIWFASLNTLSNWPSCHHCSLLFRNTECSSSLLIDLGPGFFHVKKVPNLPKSCEKSWTWKNLSSESHSFSVLKSELWTCLSKLVTKFATKANAHERPCIVLMFFCYLFLRSDRNESWRQHKIQDSRKVGRSCNEKNL